MMTVVPLPFTGNQNSVEIYPNPFSTLASIRINDQDFKNGELVIFDLAGGQQSAVSGQRSLASCRRS